MQIRGTDVYLSFFNEVLTTLILSDATKIVVIFESFKIKHISSTSSIGFIGTTTQSIPKIA